jgi:hypothetical protein
LDKKSFPAWATSAPMNWGIWCSGNPNALMLEAYCKDFVDLSTNLSGGDPEKIIFKQLNFIWCFS